MGKLSLSAILLLTALFLQSCTPIGLAVGAGATAGSVALEERSFSDSLQDRETSVLINKKFVDSSTSLFSNVSVDVVEGRVLLTGAVSTPEMRIQAVRLAWQVENVDEVINEIQVTEDGGILDRGRDKIVDTKLSAKLTLDRRVQAVNYEISVVNGSVYLFGIAQNRAEVDRVIAHARELAYVRRIIDHMQMKDSEERRAWLERREKETTSGS